MRRPCRSSRQAGLAMLGASLPRLRSGRQVCSWARLICSARSRYFAALPSCARASRGQRDDSDKSLQWPPRTRYSQSLRAAIRSDVRRSAAFSVRGYACGALACGVGEVAIDRLCPDVGRSGGETGEIHAGARHADRRSLDQPIAPHAPRIGPMLVPAAIPAKNRRTRVADCRPDRRP
jgi:hypothetical protein